MRRVIGSRARREKPGRALERDPIVERYLRGERLNLKGGPREVFGSISRVAMALTIEAYKGKIPLLSKKACGGSAGLKEIKGG